jgi:hypothetical protein
VLTAAKQQQRVTAPTSNSSPGGVWKSLGKSREIREVQRSQKTPETLLAVTEKEEAPPFCLLIWPFAF